MSDEEKQELIGKLHESWDNLNLLQHMHKKEQSVIEDKLRLIGGAKNYLGDVLYKLTGSDFYKPKEEKTN